MSWKMHLSVMAVCLVCVPASHGLPLGPCATVSNPTLDKFLGNECTIGDITLANFDFSDTTGTVAAASLLVSAGDTGSDGWISFTGDPGGLGWRSASNVWIRYEATVDSGAREFVGVASTISVSGFLASAQASHGVCAGSPFGGTLPGPTCPPADLQQYSTGTLSLLLNSTTRNSSILVGPGVSTLGIYNQVQLNVLFSQADRFRNDFSTHRLVPEPGTWSTMGVGLLGIGLLIFRRRQGRGP